MFRRRRMLLWLLGLLGLVILWVIINVVQALQANNWLQPRITQADVRGQIQHGLPMGSTEQQTIAFLHKIGAQTETSSHSNRGVISTDGFEQKDPNGRMLGAAFPNAYPGLIGSGGIYMKFGFDAKGHLTRYDMRDVYTSL